MENFNFKRVEVSGVTKEEALAKAPFNVSLPGADCTAALNILKKKNVGKPFTDADLKQFMIDQLKKKTHFSAGNGCYIVVKPASKNTRKRPYEKVNVKGEGPRKFKTFHVWRDDETGVEVCSVDTTKADAFTAMAKQYTDKGFTGNVTLTAEKRVTEGSAIEGKMKYAPSEGSCPGVYYCFGVEAC